MAACVTSTAVSYTVLAADQGKLVRATASGVTITTPDATDVLSPFVFALLNNSSGTITLDGSGSQTIDGNATVTVSAGTGMTIFTDGTNWFTTGQQGTLVGKQLQSGDLINGTISESNSSNATTYSIKTLAGNDPSSTDPVLVCFRNSTIGTGNYVYRTITAATSLTLSSGSTLGATSNVAFKVWLVIFDDSGTLRLGAINCVSGTNVYPLGRVPLVSSTAEGGAGAADSNQTFYTGTAVTTKPYVVIGYASYESGLATAGTWNVSPTRIQLYGHGVPLPGQQVQEVISIATGGAATAAGTPAFDDSIPQKTEGAELTTQAITPTSAANVLSIDAQALLMNSNAAVHNLAFILQDTTADALTAAACISDGTSTNGGGPIALKYRMIAGTTSSTTFKLNYGSTGGTVTANGFGGARKLGGVANSYLSVTEIMT